jgi:pentose-5-phosphate-3-epimerase
MQVIPALLTNSTKDLFQQIYKLLPYYKYHQIDIADEQFVPNKTVSIEEITAFIEKNNIKFDKEILFDFHLMVKDYEKELKKLKELSKLININKVFIHYKVLKEYKDVIKKHSEITIGIVIDPDDEIEKDSNNKELNLFSSIQIMSVNPGFQGSPFIKDSLKKIDYLRDNDYKGEIYIDGSVNDKTLQDIIYRKNTPDYLGIGSFLSKAPNIEDRVVFLNNILKSRSK